MKKRKREKTAEKIETEKIFDGTAFFGQVCRLMLPSAMSECTYLHKGTYILVMRENLNYI